ncbi:bifunctional folylpolyglutamate synthase/dihydrofolate synthase [Moraxella nasibovis]|uniref:bifunctional folylpolyglutamate synthase/dihydrofolate synthase n=1 Tax=Moraxella nasibovis TaxID=2904120 RepID=UPI0024107C16|nr:folylpolyglutamate synthase/dihydrofolate synthase family protein [Moraxella nasibovis]WFF39071.1 bifunctional folylpolyglutamate synthase/dihydrofolate synthase [Moraxella nasibovis]
MHNTTLTEHDSLSSWLEYIASIHVSAIDMGLDRVLPVAQKLGILKQDLTHLPYVFTVAGTNGKGSTTATIAQICQSAGYKTALYQSPHLVSFTERIKIGGIGIDEPTLVRALASVEQVRLECGLSLSFFEMTTLAAFLIFKEAACDVWVLEIGLGGRLDVVNIIDPDVAVITNVGIDHVDWLGDDIEKIGFEKAGIIRPNIPAILGARQLPNSVFEVVQNNQAYAYQLGRAYEFSEQADGWQYSSPAITLHLPKPKLSLMNAVNAVSAVLASSLEIAPHAIAYGLNQVSLAGRFDHRLLAGRQWLFDVAHNAHGMGFLLEQFIPYWQHHQAKHNAAKLHVVFSMLGDKDIGSVLDLLQASMNDGAFKIATWHIAAIDHVRAMPLSEILSLVNERLDGANIITYENLAAASAGAVATSGEQDLLLVFGSFHTVGEVLTALN